MSMSKNFSLLSKTWNKASHRSMRARFGLILLTLVFVFSLVGMTPTGVSALGNTYYVNNTVACNDTNAGTPAAPYCTIAKGVTMAQAGDTVRVLAGTYAVTVAAVRSGTAVNPITFSAAPGVIVTGNGTATGSAFRIIAYELHYC